MPLKIYSWNMLFRNQKLEQAFEFIAHADFDIFCLQEVPESFLPRLKRLPSAIIYRSDMEKLFRSGAVATYNVILSRLPIESHGEIPYPDYWPLLPLRTRLFVRLMRPFSFSQLRNRGGLYIDITHAGQSIRVFNLHLILAQPAWRLKEFEMAMTKRDPERSTIVCGDFNILEKPHITPLNWLLGGGLVDTVRYTRERTHLEKRFLEHQLTNILRGRITHPLSRSQLDHILVSRSFSIQKSEVLDDRLGSDHHPIYVEIS